jgi:P-type conjugative transfer protein TrbJ
MPGVGYGQWAVIDASNLVQNTLTAANTTKALLNDGIEIAHQVAMIKNQLDQLAYDAANLTALPLSVVQDLLTVFHAYETWLRQAQGLQYQFKTITGAFDQLYPRLGSGYTPATMSGKVRQMREQIRSAGQGAMQAQAILERLVGQKDRVTKFVQSSDAAPGQLAAQQATNSLLGVLAEQNASMEQVLAASERAHTSVLVAQAIEADAAQTLADQWLQGYGTMQPVQGVGIPTFR